MTNKEFWNHLHQEVREYLSNRYYRTTRCCLTEEQIDNICTQELLYIEEIRKVNI